MKLAIIGGGNMGGAIARALLRNQTLAVSELLIVESESTRREQLASELGCQTQEAVDSHLSQFDVVLLAVKPQTSVPVMRLMVSHLQSSQLVISIMAGISIAQLSLELRHSKLVRGMPNVPAQIGEGMTGYFATNDVTEIQLAMVRNIFSAFGHAVAVPNEDAIDATTAVSGSGPAYVYYVAEHMMAGARALGFAEEEATQLIQQTIKGAVLLWESRQTPVEELRRRVTSPGGTTEAAIQSFDSHHVGENLQEGIRQAYQRAKELAQNS